MNKIINKELIFIKAKSQKEAAIKSIHFIKKWVQKNKNIVEFIENYEICLNCGSVYVKGDEGCDVCQEPQPITKREEEIFEKDIEKELEKICTIYPNKEDRVNRICNFISSPAFYKHGLVFDKNYIWCKKCGLPYKWSKGSCECCK